MNKRNKLDENQLWTMVLTILPVVILMNAGTELTDNAGMRILYAGFFGGLGGLIGFGADFLTKDKNRIIKIFTTISIIAICGLTIYLLSSRPSDSEILKQEWVTQKIGKIEFESPTKLKLLTNEIPESVKWLYSEINLYADGGVERVTFFLQTKIQKDTFSIENAFSSSLEGMLKKINIDIKNLELEVFYADEKEVSSLFSFDLNGEKVNGYGFMYMNENFLESIWLMALKRGFSKEYIEKFEAGIFPDYE